MAIRDNFSINNEAIDRFNNSDKELIDIFKRYFNLEISTAIVTLR